MSPIDLPLSRRQVLHLPLVYGLAVCAGAGQAQPANLAPLLASGVLEIIALPPANIELYFADTLSPDTRAEAVAWVTRSALATTGYLGRFPVNNPKITLLPVSSRGISSGLTFNGPPPSIRVQVGKDTTRADFLDDWIMVHEMVHLAIPQLPRQNNWFHEGTATYVEIIARAQAGLTNWDTVWSQLITRLHLGQPQAGDKGLDNTPTWGRTYWGGALFCLLADVEIRKCSNNRVGLQDAMAGLVKSGASYAHSWTLQRTLETADHATGQTVLAERYAAMKDAPVVADLPQLWADMGISLVGNRVLLREDAPLAGARRAIERGNSAQAA